MITAIAEALAPVRHNDADMIDARSLHAWLGVGDRFDQWLKRRIGEYGFEDGEDYRTDLCVRADGRGGRRRREYLLTLDMAKELAMVERTEIGRETRRYFIRMERAALQMAAEHVQRGTITAGMGIIPHPRTGVEIEGLHYRYPIGLREEAQGNKCPRPV